MVAEAQGRADDERLRQSPIMLEEVNSGEKASYEEANVQKVHRLVFSLNGQPVELQPDDFDPSMSLNEYLRDKAGLKATKLACGEGGCGACAVVLSRMDKQTGAEVTLAVNSCLRPLASIHGWSVITNEGLSGSNEQGSKGSGSLHPIQSRIAQFHGSQCGFCTPGMVMSMYGKLHPNDGGKTMKMEDLEGTVTGNICRCTGYRPLLDVCKSFASDSDIEDLITGKAENGPYRPAGVDPVIPPSMNDVISATEFHHEGSTWYGPSSLQEALSVLSRHPMAKIVAGNTAVGIYKKEDDEEGCSNVEKEDVICFLANIPELKKCIKSGGTLEVGVGLTISELIEVLEDIEASGNGSFPILPPLIRHLKKIASPLVRNSATIGGNLLMVKKKGFDSDLAPLLLAAEANVTLLMPSGEVSTLPLYDFLSVPESVPGMLLSSVTFTIGGRGEIFKSYRVALRHSNSHALVNAAFRVVFEGEKVAKAVLFYGALGGVPIRAYKAEEALVGRDVNRNVISSVLREVRKEVIPSCKLRLRYRMDLITAFMYKFLLSLLGLSIPPRLRSSSEELERPMSSGKQRFPHPISNKGKVYKPVPKESMELQVKGQALFLDDMPTLEGTLHAAYVKSNRTCGILKKMDPSKALAYPGIVSFIDASHIPGRNDAAFAFGPYDTVADTVFVPIDGRVQYHCQPVGLILAETVKAAQEAAKLVEMYFAGFEVPVVTIADACRAESFMGLSEENKRGDVTKFFEGEGVAGCRTLKGKVKSNSQKHFYMEPHTAYAVPDEDRMVIWSSTQAPPSVQNIIGRVLDVPLHQVIAKFRRAGGGFGAKATRNLPHAAAAAVAAKALGRPVKLTLDRETDMQLTGGRHDLEAEFDVAFLPDGTLQALRCNAFLNGGFCYDLSGVVMHELCKSIEQAYNIPNLYFKSIVMRTNLPSSTTMRAPGVIQASFLIESIVDLVAAEVNLPSMVVRERNLQKRDGFDVKSKEAGSWDEYSLPRVWENLKVSGDFDAKRREVEEFNAKNKWKKKGLAMTAVRFHVFVSSMQANVNIYEDGSILIHHPGCEVGQGIHIKSAQVAVDTLSQLTDEGGLSVSMVRFGDTNTEVIPNGGFTGGSTTSERACGAVHKACQELVERLRPTKEDLVRKKGGGSVTWKELIAAAARFDSTVDLSVHTRYDAECREYYNYGASLSEVEVDGLTGEIQILSSHVLYDCGKSLNPAVDIGQVEGAFMMGLGFFLSEDVQIASDGSLRSSGTWEYKPFLADDIPVDFKVELLQDSTTDKGFLSSKASGEPPLILSTSVMMAVRDAVRAVRHECGLSAMFDLEAPATVENVRKVCGVRLENLDLAEERRPPTLKVKEERKYQVAIVGAGLGGLAVAIALRNKGIDAHVFERAASLRDVSQGLIGITPNGMKALELIDSKLKGLMFERGRYNTEAALKTYAAEGKTERLVKFEANNLSIPWAEVQHSLAKLVDKEIIHCSHDFMGYDEDADGVDVYFRGYTEPVRADLLIGVDGLFSVVRKAIVPFPDDDEVLQSCHTNWNAIMVPKEVGLPYPPPVVTITYNKCQPPRFFFIIDCGHGRLLWQARVLDPSMQYTVAPKKGHGRLGLKGVKQRVLDFVQDIPEIKPYIEATDEATIFERCLLMRKSLQRYSSLGRRVTLLGDAAHAMHSVRGQGANMTFEDAHQLGIALSEVGVSPDGIDRFERVRIPRANMVQLESNTYYRKHFETNTSDEWSFKFLNFQKYVRDYMEEEEEQ